MVLWVLNLSRIILSKRGLCVVMGFFQAALNTEHSQGAAGEQEFDRQPRGATL